MFSMYVFYDGVMRMYDNCHGRAFSMSVFFHAAWRRDLKKVVIPEHVI